MIVIIKEMTEEQANEQQAEFRYAVAVKIDNKAIVYGFNSYKESRKVYDVLVKFANGLKELEAGIPVKPIKW